MSKRDVQSCYHTFSCMCVITRFDIFPTDLLEFRTDRIADFRIEIQTYALGTDFHTKKVTALFEITNTTCEINSSSQTSCVYS